MNAHVSWRAVLLRIDESWMARDKRILTAAREGESLTAAGNCKNLWLLKMRHPCWLLLENQELGLYTNLLGIPILRRSSLGNIWLSCEELRMRVFTLLGECKIFNCWGILGLLRGIGIPWWLVGTRISDDLYWGVQNLIDSCWRGMTENLHLGGKYLCGKKDC